MTTWSHPQESDDRARSCSIRDCGCTHGSGVLGVDASHLYVLMRAVRYTTKISADVRCSMLSLLEVHRCGGSRRLVSCEECIREEILGPRSEDGGTPELAQLLTRLDIDEHFDVDADDGWQRLPAMVPLASGRVFDERDRRLTAAAGCRGIALDCDAWLVTDDEDYLSNLTDPCVQDKIAVVPVHSVVLMLAFYQCGAISNKDLEAVLCAEQERLDTNLGMQARKRTAKQVTLDRIAVRLGRMTASMATPEEDGPHG